jgi:glycosyltransferase involved in cell wall biosynthesis
MNILFLTISKIDNIEDRSIYTDLMRQFRDEGHQVHVVSSIERRFGQKTTLMDENNIKILRIKTLNLQKTNFVEKGIGYIVIEYLFEYAIKKYFLNTQFDLILFSTPPITFARIVQKLKKKYKASSYLLLKDISPQNAIDLGIIKKDSLIHRFFKKKENLTYAVSDYIGCMSPANAEYIKLHNPGIEEKKIEICPNSIHLSKKNISFQQKNEIKKKYNIPTGKDITVFIYGGNLGKPQGLDFLYDILCSNNNKNDRFFIIVGSGTEYKKIEKWFTDNQFLNALLLPSIAKNEFDKLIQSCDVGLIFLDNRFTIPNYPSRLLSYLEYRIPILAATDINTDIGKIAEKNQYGFWCENGDLDKFNNLLEKYISDTLLIREMGNNGYNYLKENYTVSKSYEIIMKHFI